MFYKEMFIALNISKIHKSFSVFPICVNSSYIGYILQINDKTF